MRILVAVLALVLVGAGAVRADVKPLLLERVKRAFGSDPRAWKYGDGNIRYNRGTFWSGWWLNNAIRARVQALRNQLSVEVAELAERKDRDTVNAVNARLADATGGLDGYIVADQANASRVSGEEAYMIVAECYRRILVRCGGLPSKNEPNRRAPLPNPWLASNGSTTSVAATSRQETPISTIGLLGIGGPAGR